MCVAEWEKSLVRKRWKKKWWKSDSLLSARNNLKSLWKRHWKTNKRHYFFKNFEKRAHRVKLQKYFHLTAITINSFAKYLPKNNSRTPNKKISNFCRVLLVRFQPSGSGDAYGENRSLTALCFMICECMQMLHTRQARLRKSSEAERGREKLIKQTHKKSWKYVSTNFVQF